MADDFERDFASLLHRAPAGTDEDRFSRRMVDRVRWAQRSRTARAIAWTATLIIVAGAAFFVTFPFLRMAASPAAHDNPIASVAFWFPYGVVAVCLALFLQALLGRILGRLLR